MRLLELPGRRSQSEAGIFARKAKSNVRIAVIVLLRLVLLPEWLAVGPSSKRQLLVVDREDPPQRLGDKGRRTCTCSRNRWCWVRCRSCLLFDVLSTKRSKRKEGKMQEAQVLVVRVATRQRHGLQSESSKSRTEATLLHCWQLTIILYCKLSTVVVSLVKNSATLALELRSPQRHGCYHRMQ